MTGEPCLRVGTLIVGLGQIGMGYDLSLSPGTYVYSHARAFSLHPAFRLLGGVDVVENRRQNFERVYQCPAFSGVETAIKKLQPQFVVIAVPTALHGEILNHVLKQSCVTAICCEKPLSYDWEEAQAMVRACADRVRLFVNYMRRSDPGVVEIKRRLDTEEIAGPVKGVAWYSKGLVHNGSHILNLLEFWLGDVVGSQVIGNGRLWDGSDPEPDLRITFGRGTIVLLAAEEEHFSHYTVELVAANGRLRYDKGGRQIDWQVARSDPDFNGHTTLGPVESIESGLNRYQWHVTDQLSKALHGTDASLCTGAQALRTLEHIQLSLTTP